MGVLRVILRDLCWRIRFGEQVPLSLFVNYDIDQHKKYDVSIFMAAVGVKNKDEPETGSTLKCIHVGSIEIKNLSQQTETGFRNVLELNQVRFDEMRIEAAPHRNLEGKMIVVAATFYRYAICGKEPFAESYV